MTAKKHHQFSATCDCTRIRVLRVYPKNNQKTAIQFLDYVLERLPFRVESIQTGNGTEFQTGFCWHVSDRGIRHIYIKPATPRPNGTVERSHRIDQEESSTASSKASSSTTPTCSKTSSNNGRATCKFDRPHDRLGGQTHYERPKQKTNRPRCQPPTPVAHQRRPHGTCGY